MPDAIWKRALTCSARCQRGRVRRKIKPLDRPLSSLIHGTTKHEHCPRFEPRRLLASPASAGHYVDNARERLDGDALFQLQLLIEDQTVRASL